MILKKSINLFNEQKKPFYPFDIYVLNKMLMMEILCESETLKHNEGFEDCRESKSTNTS